MDILGHGTGVHPLGVLGAGILAAAQRAVAEQVVQLAGQLGGSVKPGADGGSIFQLARIGGHGVNVGIDLAQGFLPGGIISVHPGQVPFVLFLDLGTLFQCFRHIRFRSFCCEFTLLHI